MLSVLHLSFTCFLSLLLWWPLLPADTGSTWSQLNESSTYTKHSQREWTLLNGWFFFLCCATCAIFYSRSVFSRVNHCCIHFSVKMFGWLGSFWRGDAQVHHVRVSRGHLVLFSSAGGWPGHLMPDDWISLWCGFDSYCDAALSSDRPMCGTVCACGLTPHLVPPNPATHMQAASAHTFMVTCV